MPVWEFTWLTNKENQSKTLFEYPQDSRKVALAAALGVSTWKNESVSGPQAWRRTHCDRKSPVDEMGK